MKLVNNLHNFIGVKFLFKLVEPASYVAMFSSNCI